MEYEGSSANLSTVVFRPMSSCSREAPVSLDE